MEDQSWLTDLKHFNADAVSSGSCRDKWKWQNTSGLSSDRWPRSCWRSSLVCPLMYRLIRPEVLSPWICPFLPFWLLSYLPDSCICSDFTPFLPFSSCQDSLCITSKFKFSDSSPPIPAEIYCFKKRRKKKITFFFTSFHRRVRECKLIDF